MEGESAHPGSGLAGSSEQPGPVLNPLSSRPVTPSALGLGCGGVARVGGVVLAGGEAAGTLVEGTLVVDSGEEGVVAVPLGLDVAGRVGVEDEPKTPPM